MILVEGLVEPGTQGASLQGCVVGLLPKLLAWPPPESHGSEGQWGSSSHLHFAHLPGSISEFTHGAWRPKGLVPWGLVYLAQAGAPSTAPPPRGHVGPRVPTRQHPATTPPTGPIRTRSALLAGNSC